jgi:hypothetical protein
MIGGIPRDPNSRVHKRSTALNNANKSKTNTIPVVTQRVTTNLSLVNKKKEKQIDALNNLIENLGIKEKETRTRRTVQRLVPEKFKQTTTNTRTRVKPPVKKKNQSTVKKPIIKPVSVRKKQTTEELKEQAKKELELFNKKFTMKFTLDGLIESLKQKIRKCIDKPEDASEQLKKKEQEPKYKLYSDHFNSLDPETKKNVEDINRLIKKIVHNEYVTSQQYSGFNLKIEIENCLKYNSIKVFLVAGLNPGINFF